MRIIRGLQQVLLGQARHPQEHRSVVDVPLLKRKQVEKALVRSESPPLLLNQARHYLSIFPRFGLLVTLVKVQPLEYLAPWVWVHISIHPRAIINSPSLDLQLSGHRYQQLRPLCMETPVLARNE